MHDFHAVFSPVRFTDKQHQVLIAESKNGTMVEVNLEPTGPSNDKMRKLVQFLFAVVNPGVLKTYGLYAVTFGGRSLCAVVVESSPGRPLSEVVASGPLSENQAAEVFQRVLLPLVFLHEKRIISLSVSTKTFSYYRSPEGAVVKMRDFRNAMNLLEDKVLIDRTNPDFPGYIAPHMEDGRPYSEQIDLYCAGALLYEIVMRTPPEFTRGAGGELISTTFDPRLYTEASTSCVELIKVLCEDEPDARLLGKYALVHHFFRVNEVNLSCQPVEPISRAEKLQPPRLEEVNSLWSSSGSVGSGQGPHSAAFEYEVEDSIFNAQNDHDSFSYWNESADSQRSGENDDVDHDNGNDDRNGNER